DRNRRAAMNDPSGAPPVMPTMMIGKSRSPASFVYTSFANDQNCATSDMLKIPTQMKKATPTYGTRAATADANSSMHAMKNRVTPTSSLARSTRDANQL